MMMKNKFISLLATIICGIGAFSVTYINATGITEDNQNRGEIYDISSAFDQNIAVTLQNSNDSEVSAPLTDNELETLIITMKSLNTYLDKSEYINDSAYSALYWGEHSIQCYVKNYTVYDDIIRFMNDNGIKKSIVDVTISPEYDFRISDGGQRSNDEINTIVADEYISLKNYLNDSGFPAYIRLTSKQDKTCCNVSYTCIEVYVKKQEDADTLKAYMNENYYWQDVVEVTVMPNLSIT